MLCCLCPCLPMRGCIWLCTMSTSIKTVQCGIIMENFYHRRTGVGIGRGGRTLAGVLSTRAKKFLSLSIFKVISHVYKFLMNCSNVIVVVDIRPVNHQPNHAKMIALSHGIQYHIYWCPFGSIHCSLEQVVLHLV